MTIKTNELGMEVYGVVYDSEAHHQLKKLGRRRHGKKKCRYKNHNIITATDVDVVEEIAEKPVTQKQTKEKSDPLLLLGNYEIPQEFLDIISNNKWSRQDAFSIERHLDTIAEKIRNAKEAEDKVDEYIADLKNKIADLESKIKDTEGELEKTKKTLNYYKGVDEGLPY